MSWEYQNPVRANILVVRSPATLRVKGYLVVVRDPRTGEEERVPIATLDAVILYGKHVALSTAVLDKLIQQRVPIILVTKDTTATIEDPRLTGTPETRWAQYRYLSDPTRRLLLARSLIKAKIIGTARTLRNIARKHQQHAPVLRSAASAVEEHIEDLEKTRTPKDVLTVEASAAKQAWTAIAETILADYKNQGFTGRNPRSRDPINQSLNYLHAIIYSHVTRALITAGLDPHLGALHTEGYGKTPLTYDFSEQFKPIALHALTLSATKTQLKTNRQGLLTKQTIKTITTTIYKILSKGNPSPKETIYKKSWHLRHTIRENTTYKPYIYTPK